MERNEIQITTLNLSVKVAVTWLSSWSPSSSEEDCARSPPSPSEIRSRQSGNGTDIFLRGFQLSPLNITPSVLRAIHPSTVNTCFKQMILLSNKRFCVPLSFPQCQSHKNPLQVFRKIIFRNENYPTTL